MYSINQQEDMLEGKCFLSVRTITIRDLIDEKQCCNKLIIYGTIRKAKRVEYYL